MTMESIDAEPGAANLGACCSCRQSGDHVRNIVTLDQRAPVPGTGWGCLVCGLPNDGAIAVVCDACLEAGAEIREVCCGQAHEDRRVAASAPAAPFSHDPARHAAYEAAQTPAWFRDPSRRCLVCGCTDPPSTDGGDCSQCVERTGEPCYWVLAAADICSACFFFDTSPDAGQAACICSVCRKPIGEEEMPYRIFVSEKNLEARFHQDCARGLGLL